MTFTPNEIIYRNKLSYPKGYILDRLLGYDHITRKENAINDINEIIECCEDILRHEYGTTARIRQNVHEDALESIADVVKKMRDGSGDINSISPHTSDLDYVGPFADAVLDEIENLKEQGC